MTNEATTPSGQPLGISHKPSQSEAMFAKFKAENKPAFIGYLPTASRTRTSRSTRSGRWSSTASTPWRSACRTPTR